MFNFPVCEKNPALKITTEVHYYPLENIYLNEIKQQEIKMIFNFPVCEKK